jgi:hypothetical protein
MEGVGQEMYHIDNNSEFRAVVPKLRGAPLPPGAPMVLWWGVTWLFEGRVNSERNMSAR